MYRLLAVAAVAASATPALAQQPHFYGSLGYSFEGAEGFELALGLQANLGDLIVVRASPLNVVLTDADGFYRDTFSNGQSRCRNESNGQFATDESCTGLDYRVDADAYIRLPGSILIGGGVVHTLSSDYTPEREGVTEEFLAIMFEFNRNFGLELRGEEGNAALRVRAAF